MREILALVEAERRYQAGAGPEPSRVVLDFLRPDREGGSLQ